MLRALLLSVLLRIGAAQFLIGRAITDITGLASEGAHYGYANPNQDARGMHSRQYARTFIIGDVTDETKRVAIVVAEITMSSQSLRDQVVEVLMELYGGLYTEKNVMISGTHSHSTPGGYHTYWMYAAPSEGFINHTFSIYASGIVESIQRAHEDLEEGDILYNTGELLNASISRSPYAYDQNPEEEKARYAHNVDKDMHVLKFIRPTSELGMLNLFPVHTTTMKSYNHLISSDNKGYAAQMFERAFSAALPGQGPVIGAFAQSNEGDVTPNIQGDLCDNTFEPCSYERSTCPEDPKDPKLCNSYGPTGDIFEDTKIIGERQYLRALEIYGLAEEIISGPVDFRHMWVNMSDVVVDDDELGPVTTCRPAMGYSFAAGATDGPGIRPFTQGELEGDVDGPPIAGGIIDQFLNGSEELQECHYPKPILLASGEIPIPFAWQPEIIPLQLFQIGSIYLVGVAAEFTTMAGRRLTETVQAVLQANGVQGARVLLMGIVNGYTSYVTTRQEYSVQRYEGASTTYGPYTLEAYQLLFSELAVAIATGEEVDEGLSPPDMRGYPDEALGPLIDDVTPEGEGYGSVLLDAEFIYTTGETVEVTFVAGNPRAAAEVGSNNVSYAEVIFVDGDLETTVYNEASWETRFHWASNCHDAAFPIALNCNQEQQSNATIQWDIPENQQLGFYKIRHSGYAKDPAGPIVPYTGESSVFEVGLL